MKTCKYLVGLLVIMMVIMSLSCYHMRNPNSKYKEDSSMYSYYDSARRSDSVIFSKEIPAELYPFKNWKIVYISEKNLWAICVGHSRSVRTNAGEYTIPMALYAGQEKKPGVLYDDWIKYDTTVKFYGGTSIQEASTFKDSLSADKWLTKFKTIRK